MAKSFCIAVNSELLLSYFNHKTKLVNSVRKQNKTNYSLCNYHQSATRQVLSSTQSLLGMLLFELVFIVLYSII